MEGNNEVLDLDAADGEAWLAARQPARAGVVVGIDLATGAVISEHAVSPPAGVANGGDRVWVTDYETDELVGIDRH